MEQRISVVINTYNAEKFLLQVLETVKDFDEIVICDMESTDKTCEIAESFGCKIVTFPKENHVSAEPARTFAIQSASCPWVLVIDADELVTPDLRKALYAHIAKEGCAEGLWIPRKNFFMGRFMHCHFPDYLLRFFIREGTTWPPYVHTFPSVNGRLERLTGDKEALALIHLANDSMSSVLKKTDLYTESEVEKKASKNYGWGALLWRPFFRFFKAYILRGGILDGKEGYIRATSEAFYQITLLAKVFEHRKTKQ